MASFRLLGPLCVTTALPVDSGTLARASMPPPGPLAPDDLDFIETKVGRNIDGTALPLSSLLRLYDEESRLYKDAVSQFGVNSYTVRYLQGFINRLAEMIAEARKPRGLAEEKLKTLLDEEERYPGKVSDKQFSEAIAEQFSAEKKMDARGQSDPTFSGIGLIAQVTDVISKRKTAELQKVIADARTPNSKVTDEQLQKALTEKLSIERQRQLLGTGGEDSGGLSQLLGEVLAIDYERRKKRAKDLIDDAKKPGSKVTDEQLSKTVSELLGIERQKQLLGFDDDTSGAEAMEILSEAIEISYERRKTALRNLLQDTKRPGNTVTRKQISDALAQVLSSERGRQLLGSSGPDTDKELSDLLERAVKMSGEREEQPPDRPGRVDVTAGQPSILSRTPFHR